MPFSSIVVATDGTLSHDLRVRDAAASARERRVPLHVVCSVRPRGRASERRLADEMPRDLVHTACESGQRDAAMSDVRSLLSQAVPGVEMHVSASDRRPAAAERALAARIGGEVYGSQPARIKWLAPLRARTRTA